MMVAVSGNSELYELLLLGPKIKRRISEVSAWLKANRQDREGCLEQQEILTALEEALREHDSLLAKHHKHQNIDADTHLLLEKCKDNGIK